jgi:hypothetical protein
MRPPLSIVTLNTNAAVESVVAEDVGRIGMSENPFKKIVEDYIDAAGQREEGRDAYYPYTMSVQVDEIQLSTLIYLCGMLSAHPDDLSCWLFQSALDVALDEYANWSGKTDGQVHNEVQEMLLQLEQQGYFEEVRKRGWVTAKREDEEET